MSKIESLQRIEKLSKEDIKVLLSFIFPEEWLFDIGEIISTTNFENILEESLLSHEIGPKISEVMDEVHARRELFEGK